MKVSNPVLVFFFGAGMELAYLYACVAFATAAIFQQTFPFPESVVSFFVAALLMLIAEGRGWRVIYIVALQALGFAPMLWRMLGIFGAWSNSFPAQSWFADYFSDATSGIQYAVFILVVVWILAFWAGGIEFARRPRNYYDLCARFDRGLMAFFALFLVRFYLQAVQGFQISETLSGFFVFPFLIFSLLAIGLARNTYAARRNFLPGYQAFGVMLSFVAFVLWAGAGLAFFFLPYLTLAAEKGNDALGVVTRPLVSIFLALLTWLFGSDFTSNALPVPPPPTQTASAQFTFPWWVETLGQILGWGVVSVVALVLVAMVAGFLYSFLRWLFSKTPAGREKKSWGDLFSWLGAQLRGWSDWLRRGRIAQNYGAAIRLYAALLAWGRSSGAPHRLTETPAEYAARLSSRFPMFAREIELIAQIFQRQVYGEINLDEQQLAPARAAWHELARPAHWSLRLKTFFRRAAYS